MINLDKEERVWGKYSILDCDGCYLSILEDGVYYFLVLFFLRRFTLLLPRVNT